MWQNIWRYCKKSKKLSYHHLKIAFSSSPRIKFERYWLIGGFLYDNISRSHDELFYLHWNKKVSLIFVRIVFSKCITSLEAFSLYLHQRKNKSKILFKATDVCVRHFSKKAEKWSVKQTYTFPWYFCKSFHCHSKCFCIL